MKKLTMMVETVSLRGHTAQFGFKDFLVAVVNSCPLFGSSLSNARRGHKLLDEIEKCRPLGGVLEVEDDLAKALCGTVDAPATPWLPHFLIGTLPFVDHMLKELS